MEEALRQAVRALAVEFDAATTDTVHPALSAIQAGLQLHCIDSTNAATVSSEAPSNVTSQHMPFAGGSARFGAQQPNSLSHGHSDITRLAHLAIAQ